MRAPNRPGWYDWTPKEDCKLPLGLRFLQPVYVLPRKKGTPRKALLVGVFFSVPVKCLAAEGEWGERIEALFDPIEQQQFERLQRKRRREEHEAVTTEQLSTGMRGSVLPAMRCFLGRRSSWRAEQQVQAQEKETRA